MNEKDKQIIRDSSEVIVDVIASKIPGLDLAWGLSKSLLGAGLKLRQERALEWVEMIRDNPTVFLEGVLIQEEFQDGFVFALEKYIRERSEGRRERYKKVFLKFAQAETKSDFELEKCYQTILLLSENNISILGYVDTRTPNSYQLFDDQQGLENVFSLINAGILILDPSARYGSTFSPYVYTSNFGRRFIKYLRQ